MTRIAAHSLHGARHASCRLRAHPLRAARRRRLHAHHRRHHQEAPWQVVLYNFMCSSLRVLLELLEQPHNGVNTVSLRFRRAATDTLAPNTAATITDATPDTLTTHPAHVLAATHSARARVSTAAATGRRLQLRCCRARSRRTLRARAHASPSVPTDMSRARFHPISLSPLQPRSAQIRIAFCEAHTAVPATF